MPAAKKNEIHDPTQSLNHMSEDSLLQCTHEAAAEHTTPLFPSISFRSTRHHGFQPTGACQEGAHQEWKAAEVSYPVLLYTLLLPLYSLLLQEYATHSDMRATIPGVTSG